MKLVPTPRTRPQTAWRRSDFPLGAAMRASAFSQAELGVPRGPTRSRSQTSRATVMELVRALARAPQTAWLAEMTAPGAPSLRPSPSPQNRLVEPKTKGTTTFPFGRSHQLFRLFPRAELGVPRGPSGSSPICETFRSGAPAYQWLPAAAAAIPRSSRKAVGRVSCQRGSG
jgi:hypothetical protein